MLIYFSVENYLSFKDRTELSFEASPAVKELPGNILSAPRMAIGGKEQEVHCLRSVALVGANASGKSNMLQALGAARNFLGLMRSVGESQNFLSNLSIPFLLDAESREKPSCFEFCLLLKKVQYRYGFSVKRGRVWEEWLLLADKGKERLAFHRAALEEGGSRYDFGSGFRKFKTIAKDDMVRDDYLLLTVADKFNIPEAIEIFNFLSYFRGIDSKGNIQFRDDQQEMLAKLLRFADIGIAGLSIVEEEDRELRENRQILEREKKRLEPLDQKVAAAMEVFLERLTQAPEPKVSTIDFLYQDSQEEKTPIPLGLQSTGTLTFMELFCNILESYPKNTVLFCDEIESSLHPMLCEAFFDLFHNMPGNKAQLVFTTHNTLLLNSENFRRDQIYITEKDATGQSTLVGLDEYTGVRKGASYGKQYLDGRFGGIPILNQRFKRELYRIMESMQNEKAAPEVKAHG